MDIPKKVADAFCAVWDLGVCETTPIDIDPPELTDEVLAHMHKNGYIKAKKIRLHTIICRDPTEE